MSHTTTLYPILVALESGLYFGKNSSEYVTVNELQKTAMTQYYPHRKEAEKFSGEEMKSVASNDVNVINNFLGENNFQIKLDPFSDPSDFGTAAVMNVLATWKHPGEKRKMMAGGFVYDGAFLEDGVTVTRVANHEHPIAHIRCENGDTVHMTIADKAYSGFDLQERIASFSQENSVPDFSWDGLHFPMVQLNQEEDISFFKEMWFTGVSNVTDMPGKFTIKQALQQTKFKMNHLGARAESAVAFGFAFESCMVSIKPALVINKEFFVWITRPGQTLPIFSAYVSKDDWKDPGAL